ncbi:hypothetical protein HY989_03955 [Candidatus Micrarchaeota archaeon]|nr:hypothetical protein [Candidatus Micrarchaeota archaeon]
MLIAVIALLTSFLFGYFVSRKLFSKELFSSSVLFGIMGFSWIVFIVSLFAGFNEISILVTCAILAILSAVLAKFGNYKLNLNNLFSKDSFLVFAVSFLLIGISSYLAFENSNSLSTVSIDVAFHAGILNTLANGNFPPTYPNFSSEPLSYYYFLHLFGASLILGGIDVFLAFQLLQTLLIAALIAAYYVFSRDFLKSKLGGTLAVLLIFLISPSTGSQLGGISWFSAFFHNFSLGIPSKGFPFGPTILTLSFIQFSTAFALLFFAILLRYLINSEKPSLNIAAICIAFLPMFNAPYFFGFTLIFLIYLIFQKKSWLPIGIIFLISLPQFVFLFSQKTSFLQYLRLEIYGGNSFSDLALFWLQNAGFHIILGIIGIIAMKKQNQNLLKITVGSFILFAIGNFIKFAPNALEGHKLFLPFLILLGVYSAGILAQWLGKRGQMRFAIIIFLGIGLISSYFQFFVYLQPESIHTPVLLGNGATFSACNWAKFNTPKNAVFVADEAPENGACLFVAAGRRAYFSIPYVVSTHGFDAFKAKEIQSSILSGNLVLARQSQITHVFANSKIESQIGREFRKHLKQIYSNGEITIYSVNYP